MGPGIHHSARKFILIAFFLTACVPTTLTATQIVDVPTSTGTPQSIPTTIPSNTSPTRLPTTTPLPTGTPPLLQDERFLLPSEVTFYLKAHLSVDGSLAGLSTKESLYVFHTRPFKLAYRIDTPNGSKNFAFSADGKLGAITLSNEVNVQLFDAQTGKFTQTLLGEKQTNDTLLFSADKKTLIGLSDTFSVDVWDVATGKHRNWFIMQGKTGQKGLSYNGATIAVGGVLNFTSTGEPVPDSNWMHSLSTLFTPAGLCIRTTGNMTPAFSVAHGPDFETEIKGIWALATSDRLMVSSMDENLIAIQTTGSTVIIANAFTGKILKTDILPDNRVDIVDYVILDMTLTPDGKLLELLHDQTIQNQYAVFVREVDLNN